MKKTRMALSAAVLIAMGAGIAPSAATAATTSQLTTSQPTDQTATHQTQANLGGSVGVGANDVGSQFTVVNNTSHTETIKYDSDGSGHGSSAQFLNADGSDVTPGANQTIEPGMSRTFYIEMSCPQGEINHDAAADVYLINVNHVEGKIHIHGHNEDLGSYSWETWDTNFNGARSHTQSRAHVYYPDLEEDGGHFSGALSAASTIELN